MKKVKVFVSGRPSNCREVTFRLTLIKNKIEYTITKDKADLIILANNFNIFNADLKLMIQKIEEIFYNQNKRVII